MSSSCRWGSPSTLTLILATQRRLGALRRARPPLAPGSPQPSPALPARAASAAPTRAASAAPARFLFLWQDGFFWDEAYAAAQLASLMAEPGAAARLRGLVLLLTTAELDAQPLGREAQRRLTWYAPRAALTLLFPFSF